MNPCFGFGQPTNSIIQYAYVVPDIHIAMQEWFKTLGLGPWYIAENFGAGPDAMYRNEPANALLDVALSFSGHIQVELIQMNDENPSVFKEAVSAQNGFGFHHFGRATTNFDEDHARYVDQGYEVLFTDKAPPNGNRIAYLDKRDGLPGMIELIEADVGLDTLFTKIYESSIGWDGDNPVRPIAELFL